MHGDALRKLLAALTRRDVIRDRAYTDRYDG
jgi:hypothetical protein